MIDVNSFSEDILREMNTAYLMVNHEFKCMPENEKPSKQQHMFKWLKRKISINLKKAVRQKARDMKILMMK